MVRWLDNKVVHLISTFTGVEPLGSVLRWNAIEKKKTCFPCPSIVYQYNQNMGGVDLCDMFLALYRIDKKSKKWYNRIVYFLISIAVTNAWILYKKINHDLENILLREFILSVSTSLTKSGKDIEQPKQRGRPRQTLHDSNNQTLKRSMSDPPFQKKIPLFNDDTRYDVLVNGSRYMKKEQGVSYVLCTPIVFVQNVESNYVLQNNEIVILFII